MLLYSVPSLRFVQGWLDIYRQYISLIYIGYISDIFVRKYRIFSIFSIFIEFYVTHCDIRFDFQSVCFASLWLFCPQHFSVLDNFCQIAPFHSNAVWMTTVLHLICNAHTHSIISGSKFHIILAMYVQMLDIYVSKMSIISKISKKNRKYRTFSIFSNPSFVKLQRIAQRTEISIRHWTETTQREWTIITWNRSLELGGLAVTIIGVSICTRLYQRTCGSDYPDWRW